VTGKRRGFELKGVRPYCFIHFQPIRTLVTLYPRILKSVACTFLLAWGLGMLASAPAYARGGGGDYAPIFQLGTNFHSGKTGQSLTGLIGYDLDLRSEKRMGFFRTSFAMNLEFASGAASIGTATPSGTMFGGAFLGGFNLFPFNNGRFQPYLGASPVLSWNILKLTGPPTGVEPNTQSLGYGYQLNVGVDFRFGNVDGNAMRLESSFWSVSAMNLGGQAGFELTGWRFGVGLVY
jgi:hypothetical protein